jgi:glycosyltransferase involved in cell wall biosynthesis
MKVSIITAVYNGAERITKTLNSVAQQDYGSIEHIVVDGASTDATLERVQANGARVARVISEPDFGVYDAFNKGLRAATGDIIAFLGAGDTYASPHVISRIAEELTIPSTQAVFADLMIVDEHDQSRVVRIYRSKYFSPNAMTYGFMPAHPTLFLRRDVYQMAGEYDTRYRIAGDFEMCLRIFVKRSIRYKYIPQPLVLMPRGGLSNSGWRSKWEITREMRQACAACGLRTNTAKLLLRLPAKLLEMRYGRWAPGLAK